MSAAKNDPCYVEGCPDRAVVDVYLGEIIDGKVEYPYGERPFMARCCYDHARGWLENPDNPADDPRENEFVTLDPRRMQGWTWAFRPSKNGWVYLQIEPDDRPLVEAAP